MDKTISEPEVLMQFSHWMGSKILAGALALTLLPAALPSQTPLVGVTAAHAQYYGRGGYYGGPRHYRDRGFYRGGHRGYYGGPRYYGGRHYGHRRGNGGAALAGAIVGLGVGAAIASSAQPRYYEAPRYAAPAYRARPWTRDWYRYCAARYRSFDPGSGTFQPYNGPRQLCR